MKTENHLNDTIEAYKRQLKEYEEQIVKLRQKVSLMNAEIRTAPKDKWYLLYLMKENSALERECENRQGIIEQYQKHYAKWGHFYSEYENR